jgi:hypothetical protein
MAYSQGTSKRTRRAVDYTREHKMKLWEEMQVQYMRDCMLTLSDMKRQNDTVVDCLNHSQLQFIKFLERQSNM